jgi:hypothetical protein
MPAPKPSVKSRKARQIFGEPGLWTRACRGRNGAVVSCQDNEGVTRTRMAVGTALLLATLLAGRVHFLELMDKS